MTGMRVAGARVIEVRRLTGPVAQSVWVGGLCLVVAVVLNTLLIHQAGFSGDEAYYARIADHPAGPHTFPYAFRVGPPYLVHLLPFSHSFSWELLALLAAGIAGGAMFALLRESVGVGLALGLAVAFVISPPLLVVFLRNGIEVDAAAIAVITLGCLFIVRRQRLALAITLLLGATVHESCLFLVPLAYAVWAEGLVDRRALRNLALVALAPILLYAYLRASIMAVGESYQPGYSGSFLSARVDVLRRAVQYGGSRSQLSLLCWRSTSGTRRTCRFTA